MLIDVTERGLHLSTSLERLIVSKDGEQIFSVPFQEMDALIVAESAVSMTGVMLAQMAEARVPVIICDRKYLPSCVLCPVIREGAEYHSMLFEQTSAPVPWKKQIWKALVCSKICGQHRNLIRRGLPDVLGELPKKVRSGDTGNVEAEAAAKYWNRLAIFPARDRLAEDANIFFNYAYAILYAAFARCICAAAMNPHIGVHHHNRYNPFSLASDLMEPYRPFTDRAVFALLEQYPEATGLNKETRGALIQKIYAQNVSFAGKIKNMLASVADCVHSYKVCLRQKTVKDLILPEEV